MIKIFSDKEMALITDTLDSAQGNYRTVLKCRIINKLQVLKISFKNLIGSKLNNMKIKDILNSIGLTLYPNLVEQVIWVPLTQDKIDLTVNDELETFLIKQREVIGKYLNSKHLNSKMRKVLRNMAKDIRKKGIR